MSAKDSTTLPDQPERHGKLVILRIVRKDERSRFWCWCRCDCGTEKEIRLDAVRGDRTRSCGCTPRHHPPDLLARIMAGIEVDPETQCWVWKKSVCHSSRLAYGKISVACKTMLVHRVMWSLTFGPIPEGKAVLHRCDKPLCCNPEHLFLGTALDNSKDMVGKGRSLVGDRNPSRQKPDRLLRGEQHPCVKLTDEQVAEIRTRYVPGVVTLKSLAAEYGVHLTTIWNIAKGKRK